MPSRFVPKNTKPTGQHLLAVGASFKNELERLARLHLIPRRHTTTATTRDRPLGGTGH